MSQLILLSNPKRWLGEQGKKNFNLEQKGDLFYILAFKKNNKNIEISQRVVLLTTYNNLIHLFPSTR